MKNGLEYSWFLSSQAISIEMDKQSQPTSHLGVKSFLYLLGMCWSGHFHWCCQLFLHQCQAPTRHKTNLAPWNILDLFEIFLTGLKWFWIFKIGSKFDHLSGLSAVPMSKKTADNIEWNCQNTKERKSVLFLILFPFCANWCKKCLSPCILKNYFPPWKF